jgi:hypothetical protein
MRADSPCENNFAPEGFEGALTVQAAHKTRESVGTDSLPRQARRPLLDAFSIVAREIFYAQTSDMHRA